MYSILRTRLDHIKCISCQKGLQFGFIKTNITDNYTTNVELDFAIILRARSLTQTLDMLFLKDYERKRPVFFLSNSSRHVEIEQDCDFLMN